MKGSDKVNAYLDAVCARIRFRQAHDTVRRELSAHIEDQAERYMAEGAAPEDALSRAVADMGDPHDVGLRLDSAYRPKPAPGLLIPLAILLLLGALLRFTVYGAWTMGAKPHGHDVYMARYVLSLAFGAGLFALFYRMNLYRFVRLAPYLYLGAVLFTEAACLLGNAGYHGLRIGAACYSVCILPPLFAGLIYSLRGRGLPGLLLAGAAVAVPALRLASVPASGAAVMLVLSSLAVLTAGICAGVFGGTRRKKALALIITYGGVIAAGALLLLTDAYRTERLMAALNPSADSSLSYIAAELRAVLGASNFIGEGSLLPYEPAYDYDLIHGGSFSTVNQYLLTHLAYRFGYIVPVAVGLVFAAFLAAGTYRACRLKSLAGRLTCLALVVSPGVQALAYISGNLGLAIGSPLPLPFVSYGNTALVINLAMAGLLASLLRADGLYTDTCAAPRAGRSLRFGRACFCFTAEDTISWQGGSPGIMEPAEKKD